MSSETHNDQGDSAADTSHSVSAEVTRYLTEQFKDIIDTPDFVPAQVEPLNLDQCGFALVSDAAELWIPSAVDFKDELTVDSKDELTVDSKDELTNAQIHNTAVATWKVLAAMDEDLVSRLVRKANHEGDVLDVEVDRVGHEANTAALSILMGEESVSDLVDKANDSGDTVQEEVDRVAREAITTALSILCSEAMQSQTSKLDIGDLSFTPDLNTFKAVTKCIGGKVNFHDFRSSNYHNIFQTPPYIKNSRLVSEPATVDHLHIGKISPITDPEAPRDVKGVSLVPAVALSSGVHLYLDPEHQLLQSLLDDINTDVYNRVTESDGIPGLLKLDRNYDLNSNAGSLVGTVGDNWFDEYQGYISVDDLLVKKQIVTLDFRHSDDHALTDETAKNKFKAAFSYFVKEKSDQLKKILTDAGSSIESLSPPDDLTKREWSQDLRREGMALIRWVSETVESMTGDEQSTMTFHVSSKTAKIKVKDKKNKDNKGDDDKSKGTTSKATESKDSVADDVGHKVKDTKKDEFVTHYKIDAKFSCGTDGRDANGWKSSKHYMLDKTGSLVETDKPWVETD